MIDERAVTPKRMTEAGLAEVLGALTVVPELSALHDEFRAHLMWCDAQKVVPFPDVLPLLRAGLRWRRWARGIESRGRVVRALLEEVDTILIKLTPEQREAVER